MLERTEGRRRRRVFVYWLLRIVFAVGLSGLLLLEIYTIYMMKEDIVDRRGEGSQRIREYTAAESIAAGSVVSFDEDGLLRRGLTVDNAPIRAPDLATACTQAEMESQACRWTPSTTLTNASIVQFRVSFRSPTALSPSGSAYLEVSQLFVSGRLDPSTQPSAVTLATATNRGAITEVSLLTATVDSNVAGGLGASTGQVAALILLVFADRSADYIAVSGNIWSGDTSSWTQVVLQTWGSTSSTSSAPFAPTKLGFVHFTDTAPWILTGVPCSTGGGDGSCCLTSVQYLTGEVALADPLTTACPNATVASFGEYVGLGTMPFVILRARFPTLLPATSVQPPKVTLVQQLNLPWDGDVTKLIAVPATHPQARFVLLCSKGFLFRSFDVVPQGFDPTVSNDSSVGWKWRTGDAIQSPLGITIEAAIFLPSTIDLFLVVSEGGGLKFAMKQSLLTSTLSSAIFLETASPAPTAAMYYDKWLGSPVFGGPGATVGSSTLTKASWFGGKRLAGIAQEPCTTGALCSVVRSGISNIHTNLWPGERYISNSQGELSIFRGAISYVRWSQNTQPAFPSLMEAVSNNVIVGVALSASEIEVYLH